MEYETDFLKMPLVYQMNVIKKGGRKAKTITVVETVEIPVPCLPDDAQPIGILSGLSVSLPLTDEQRSEIRKGDYQFFELEINGQKELVSTYINMIERYNEDRKSGRIIPMRSSLFRGNTHTLNGEDTKIMIDLLNQSEKIETKKNIMKETMVDLGLVNPDASAPTDEIIVGDPGDVQILSSNKDKRIAQLMEQMKGWCIHKDRLYLPTTGPYVYVENNPPFEISDETLVHIKMPEIKNPLIKQFDEQFGINGYYSKPCGDFVRMPFSDLPKILHDLPPRNVKNLRGNMTISDFQEFAQYETYSIYDNIISYIQKCMNDTPLNINASTSLESVGVVYELKDTLEKFKQSHDKSGLMPFLFECLIKYYELPDISIGRYQSPEKLKENASNVFKVITGLETTLQKNENVSSPKM